MRRLDLVKIILRYFYYFFLFHLPHECVCACVRVNVFAYSKYQWLFGSFRNRWLCTIEVGVIFFFFILFGFRYLFCIWVLQKNATRRRFIYAYVCVCVYVCLYLYAFVSLGLLQCASIAVRAYTSVRLCIPFFLFFLSFHCILRHNVYMFVFSSRVWISDFFSTCKHHSCLLPMYYAVDWNILVLFNFFHQNC